MIAYDDFERFNKRGVPIFFELLKGAELRLTEIPQAHKNAKLKLQAKEAEATAKSLRKAAGHLKAFDKGEMFLDYRPQDADPDALETTASELDALASALLAQADLSRCDNQAHIKEAIHALAFAFWHGTGTKPGFSRKAAELTESTQAIVEGSFTDFAMAFYDSSETNITIKAFAALVEKALPNINADLPPLLQEPYQLPGSAF
jgi:hypothetical protein